MQVRGATSAADDVASGDLPAIGKKEQLEIIEDAIYDGCTDTGRAMLQIIHDVAPGAELKFHTGLFGEPDMAKAIRKLEKKKCDIVSTGKGRQ